MQERKFKVVKLTPIALATCERCNALFQSYERVEDEAEREMKVLFDGHHCEPAVVSNAVLEQPSVFFHTIAETEIRLVISTCGLCGRRVASSDSEVLRVAEQAHDCANEGTSRERLVPIHEEEH
jgi:NMD protein affecting ribosome stability and mRNA decay